VSKIMAQLLEFKRLPDGWHYGTGVGLTREAEAVAVQIADLLTAAGCDKIRAFPACDGGVLISAFLRPGERKGVNVMVEHDGEASIDFDDE